MDPLTTQSAPRPQLSDARPSQPHRLEGALFQPIGDEGRAELVERRLVDAIHRGHLRAGERLPSESDLARSFGVAPVTVREALLALRGRGLIVTRRGRNGGSFVIDDADPLAYALAAVRATSRLALRDLGAHYSAITAAALRMAARRADQSETQIVRRRLERLETLEPELQRRLLDDALVELVALSQSARLTREQMKLQAEFSPYLRLGAPGADGQTAQCAHLRAIIDAVDAAGADAAATLTEQMVTQVIDELIALPASAASSP